MKKLIVGLGLAALMTAIPTLAKDTNGVWPDYSKWVMTKAEAYLATPANPLSDYGVPYLNAVRLNLGGVRYYLDNKENPQMMATELVILGKVVGRSMQKKGESPAYQLLVDGKWRNIAEMAAIYLIDAKALFQKGEMKGVIVEAETEDGTKLQTRVTP